MTDPTPPAACEHVYGAGRDKDECIHCDAPRPTTTAARRYCSDFWRQWGLPDRCCQSCHEDRDEGYEMMDPPDGSPGEVCCYVVHEWERQTANAN